MAATPAAAAPGPAWPFLSNQYAPPDPRAEVFANWGKSYKEVADPSHEFDHVLDGTLVELHISCRALVNADATGKSDPVAFVYESRYKRMPRKTLRLVGLTETISNDLNPVFTRPVYLRVRKADLNVHVLKIGVYDVDKVDALAIDLFSHDFLGSVAIPLADVLRAPGLRLETLLGIAFDPRTEGDGFSPATTVGRPAQAGTSARGTLTVQAQIVDETVPHGIVNFCLAATDLDKMDTGGKSDPFCVVHRETMIDSRQFVAVYRTPVIMKELNPIWPAVTMPVCSLVANDLDRPLRFDVYDWDASGPEFIGSCASSLRQLMHGETAMPLINADKLAKSTKKKNENSGVLRVFNVAVRRVPGGAISEIPPPIDRIEMRAIETWTEADLGAFLTIEKKMPPSVAAHIAAAGVSGAVLLSLTDTELNSSVFHALAPSLSIGQLKNLQASLGQLRALE